jgi:hypothetical protein
MMWRPSERDGLPEFVDVFPLEQEAGQYCTADTVLFVDDGSAGEVRVSLSCLGSKSESGNYNARLVACMLWILIAQSPHPGSRIRSTIPFTPRPVEGKSRNSVSSSALLIGVMRR